MTVSYLHSKLREKFLFLFFLALPVLLLEMGLRWKPSWILPAGHHRDWGAVKEFLDQIHAPAETRLLVVGASSTLFAIDAKKVCKQLGLAESACIQASMPGGTPIDAAAAVHHAVETKSIDTIVFGFDNSLLREKLANQAFYIPLSEYRRLELQPALTPEFARFVSERMSAIVAYQQDLKSNAKAFLKWLRVAWRGKGIEQIDKKEGTAYEYFRKHHLADPPLTGPYTPMPQTFPADEISEAGKNRILRVLEDTRKAGTKVLFVRIPMYTGININTEIDDWLQEKMKEYPHMSYFNPRKAIEIRDVGDFFDGDHMSDQGRRRVTDALIEKIKAVAPGV